MEPVKFVHTEPVKVEVGAVCIRSTTDYGASFEKGKFYWIVRDEDAGAVVVKDGDGNERMFAKHKGDGDYFQGSFRRYFKLVFV